MKTHEVGYSNPFTIGVLQTLATVAILKVVQGNKTIEYRMVYFYYNIHLLPARQNILVPNVFFNVSSD